MHPINEETKKGLKQDITRFYKLPFFELVIKHDFVGPILAHETMFYFVHPNGAGFTLFN
jgi:hypothetical protein